MGIKGLTNLKLPKKSIPVEDFVGKTIAIDANQFMYAFSYTVCNRIASVDGQIDEQKAKSEILKTFIRRLGFFIGNKIDPILVFDGKSIEEKYSTLAKRKETRERLKQRVIEAVTNNNLEVVRKGRVQLFRLSYESIAEISQTLQNIGFSVYHMDDVPDFRIKDGEAFCAYLCMHGICDAAMTTDTDFHVFGGELALTGMSEEISIDEMEMIVERKVFETRSLTDILNHLDLDFKQFVDACILMGTDYNNNMRGCGPKKSLDYIRKFGSLEDIKEPEIPKDHFVTREIFQRTMDDVHIMVSGFSKGKYLDSGRKIVEKLAPSNLSDYDGYCI